MTNPFAQSVPAEQAPAPAPAANPFGGQQQTAPAAPQAYAQPQANPYAGAQQAVQQGQHPVQQAHAQQQAPAQQAYAPQQTAPTGPPQFGTPVAAPAPVVGEGKGAKLADMYSRLVLIFPLKLEQVPRNPQFITAEQRAAGNTMQKRLTATVVVLDGGPMDANGRPNMAPISWGGAPYALPPTPYTNTDPLPYVRKGMWINQSRLISQCEDSLPGGPMAGPSGAPGMIVGRVHKSGPNQNDPWYLIGATEREVELANYYLTKVQDGTYPNPLA